MNKTIIEISNYKKFKCIADKCKLTCCNGWDINIDKKTYLRWKQTNKDYMLKNVKKSNNEYCINKDTKEQCPFLQEDGLCEIVKKEGENFLSATCNMFPRIENVFRDVIELTLSCSCPVVVDIFNDNYNKVEMNKNIKIPELRSRELLMGIMYREDILLEYKLISCYHILITILTSKDIGSLDIFRSKEYINELVKSYKSIEIDAEGSFEELNNLFLDIIENYKEVSILKNLFKDIVIVAENIDTISFEDKWYNFKLVFNKYNDLLEKCIVSKILSSCVSEDIENQILSFEMIILEYLLVRYSMFLKYYESNTYEIFYEDVRDYIVAFSRIIGNNIEAMIEFFQDGFDNEILEIGYLCYITLF